MRRQLIGDLIELQRRRIDVDPLGTYEEIGVRSFGQGLFHKEPVDGIALGNKRVFEVQPGDLIFSNVFAWEGAVALAGPAEAGRCGSHRFMTYTAKTEDVDLGYLRYYFMSEPGLAALGVASPGSAGRNRTLGPDVGGCRQPAQSRRRRPRCVGYVWPIAAVGHEPALRCRASAWLL